MTSKAGYQEIAIVDYNDVVQDHSKEHNLGHFMEQAFGASSKDASPLGVIAIRNVPGFVEAKRQFFPMAHKLAHLPKDYLENNLTDPESLYNAGWSHGKEKLGDQPDFAKGSFYFNPLTDMPGSEEDRKKYPVSYPCNLWPEESKVPGFEKAAKHLGKLMKDVTAHLSKHIDAYVNGKVPDYAANTLFAEIDATEKAKGRLLYYFPLDDYKTGASEDSWIGWHNDSGFLTALAGDMYIDDATGEILEKSPDPSAGLYVVGRNDEVIQVNIPSDCMAVQLGECVQIMTGGAVVATPHCVRGAAANGVSRISLPCFIDTPPVFPLTMPPGFTREQVVSSALGSSRVPPLETRWTEDGQTFGDFLGKTFAMYYEWSQSDK